MPTPRINPEAAKAYEEGWNASKAFIFRMSLCTVLGGLGGVYLFRFCGWIDDDPGFVVVLVDLLIVTAVTVPFWMWIIEHKRRRQRYQQTH